MYGCGLNGWVHTLNEAVGFWCARISMPDRVVMRWSWDLDFGVVITCLHLHE